MWATFPRQDEAMKYAKDYEGVHIFSYQNHASGQRRFLVSTYKEFWRRCMIQQLSLFIHYRLIAYKYMTDTILLHLLLGTKT